MFKFLCVLLPLILCAQQVFCVEITKDWWQHATFYQIYPRSFMDSNGDGIGDLRGITSKLDHLQDIGVNAIWMSPIFQSEQADFGYDITDFRRIHDEYGTWEDYLSFMARAKELNISVVLDFVPNHSSNMNEWFIKSEYRIGGYDDYYVWHDGVWITDDIEIAPNNWRSVFGGSAWTYSPVREQWYLHQFSPEQPDLNYRNPAVVREMADVLNFWLETGVAGFRVDAVNHLFEDDQFLDEPRNPDVEDPDDYEFLLHIYTKDQPESYEMVYDWRAQLEKYQGDNDVASKILMTEAYASIEDTMRYYVSQNGTLGAHLPFNFQLIYLYGNPLAYDVKRSIDWWLDNMPEGHTASWVIGSHDHSRVATRFRPDLADAMSAINLMLPGTSITYYGEEIGMSDNWAMEVIRDDRDHYRTPMQWSNSISAGFSRNATTWLPVHDNHVVVNVETEKAADRSHYHFYKELSKLRSEPTIAMGTFASAVIQDYSFGFVREYPELPTYVVLANFADYDAWLDVTPLYNKTANLTVVASAVHSAHRIGDIVDITSISMGHFDVVVLTAPSSASKLTALTLFSLIAAILLRII